MTSNIQVQVLPQFVFLNCGDQECEFSSLLDQNHYGMNVLLQEKNLAESDNILRAFAFSKKYRSMPFGYRQGNPRILFDSQSRHQRIAQDRFPLQEGSIADKTIPNLIFVSRNSTFATGARVWLPFIRVAHLDPATLAL